MSAQSLAVVMLLVAGLLGGCASRYVEPGAAVVSSLSHGNATVSKVTYFAAWVDEPGAAEPAATASPASVATSPAKPASTSTAKPAASDKRSKRKSPPAAAARAEATPVRGATTAPGPARPGPPQPRYEYTLELDGGGVQTVVGNRDLGIRVNDRVLVQGGTVTALAN